MSFLFVHAFDLERQLESLAGAVVYHERVKQWQVIEENGVKVFKLMNVTSHHISSFLPFSFPINVTTGC